MKKVSLILIVAVASTLCSPLGDDLDLKDLLNKLITNTEKYKVLNNVAFNIPTNNYINGIVQIVSGRNVGQEKAKVEIENWLPLVNSAKFRVTIHDLIHNGVYHNELVPVGTKRIIKDRTSFSAILNNLVMDIETKINSTQVWDLTAAISVKKVHFHIHGLMNNKTINAEVQDYLNNELPELIKTDAASVTKAVSPILENIINSLY